MSAVFVRRGVTETATSSTMSRLEAATTELSAMRPELKRLQAENARLREDRPERAAEIDRVVEAERLKELHAQALQDIQAKEEQIVAAQSDLVATQEQLTLGRPRYKSGKLNASRWRRPVTQLARRRIK